VKSASRLERLRRFATEYTDGLKSEDVRRLFDRDALRAYQILTRDQPQEEPKPGLKGWFHRARLVFLGLSAKLTPARRMLFALAVLTFLCGLALGKMTFRSGEGDQAPPKDRDG